MGRARYGGAAAGPSQPQQQAYADNNKYYANAANKPPQYYNRNPNQRNPALQPLSNNQLNQDVREAERLQEVSRVFPRSHLAFPSLSHALENA